MRTSTQTLQCVLTQKEKAEKSEEMTKRVLERKAQKDEAKRIAEGFTARVKLLDQEIEADAQTLERGTEFRPVECLSYPDFDRLEMITVRADTNEEIGRRTLEPDERQLSFIENRDAVLAAAAEEIQGIIREEDETATVEVVSGKTIADEAMRLVTEEINNGALDGDGLTCTATVSGEDNATYQPIENDDDLTLDDYIAFAKEGTSVSQPISKAQDWYESGEIEKTVREWKRMKADGTLPASQEKPAAKPSRKKGSAVEKQPITA